MNVRNSLATISMFGLLLAGSPAFAAVHAGDSLFVTVYEHPELTGLVPVDAGEQISLPLAGNVNVRGLSTSAIASRVRTRLAAYILQPAVSVQLKAQQASLFVSGGPGGTLKYEPGETLLAALGDLAPHATEIPGKDGTLAAGDLSALQRSRVDLRRVGVVRDYGTVETFDVVALAASGKLSPRLMPGDTIVLVDKPNAVRVLGDVLRPGTAYLSNDEPLADAVVQSGGVLPSAATANIELLRNGDKQLLALGDSHFNAPAKNGDAITIPSAPRVSIAGLVEKPGGVSLKTDTSLLSALYEAGGPSKWADLAHVKVISSGTTTAYDVTKLIHGDTSQNPHLRDGDLVFVPEGHKLALGSLFQSILSAAFLLK